MKCFPLQTSTCCSAVPSRSPNPNPVLAPRMPLPQRGSLSKACALAARTDSKSTLPSPASIMPVTRPSGFDRRETRKLFRPILVSLKSINT